MNFILDCQSINDGVVGDFSYLADGFDFNNKVSNSLSVSDKVKSLTKIQKNINKKTVFIGLNAGSIADMVSEAIELSKACENLSICIKGDAIGVDLCNKMVDSGISTSLSPCTSLSKAIIFAKCGISYIFIPIGKLEDVSINGIELVAEVRNLLDTYPDMGAQVVSRSIRSLIHFSESAKVGSDAVCISSDMIGKVLLSANLG